MNYSTIFQNINDQIYISNISISKCVSIFDNSFYLLSVANNLFRKISYILILKFTNTYMYMYLKTALILIRAQQQKIPTFALDDTVITLLF